MAKPRYNAHENTLKAENLVWIPGYENRYAFNERTGDLYYLSGNDCFYRKDAAARIGSNDYKWKCVVDGSVVEFTTQSIRHSLSNNQRKRDQPVITEKPITKGSYSVCRVIYDAAKKKESIEPVEVNLTSTAALELASELTIKELRKFVIVQVQSIVTFSVSANFAS